MVALENRHGYTLDIRLHPGEIMYWYLYHIFVCDVGSKERFGTPEDGGSGKIS